MKECHLRAISWDSGEQEGGWRHILSLSKGEIGQHQKTGKLD